jgi:hypothetical protein
MTERMQSSSDAALARLRKAGKLREGARLSPVEMPRPFAEALGRVLALEAGGPRLAALETHYLDLMPAMRAEQLCTSETPAHTFFQAPLRWDHLPRLSAAVERLRALLAEVGAPPLRTDGETLGDLYQTTFYGGFMPLLYGAPGDLAHFARAAGSLDEVIDRYLAAPLIHELTHLHRERRVFPLYLDECVAGWVGVHVMPEFAFPRHDDGLYAAPWFSQVGQALARVAGRRNLVRAHAGVVPWEEALPRGLAAALERLGWEDYLESRRLHLLSDNFHPEPWLKLFFLAQAELPLTELTLTQLRELPWSEVPSGDESELDGELVRDGLRAMCLHNYRNERSFRVEMRPPRGPIAVDAANCRMSTPGGEQDSVPLAYLFPPAVAARLPHDYLIELRSLDAIDELARAIVDGAPARERTEYSFSVRRRPGRRGSAG